MYMRDGFRAIPRRLLSRSQRASSMNKLVQLLLLAASISVLLSLTVAHTQAEKQLDISQLGYENASAWKAVACQQDKLSVELNQTCPLMAVVTDLAFQNHNPDQGCPSV